MKKIKLTKLEELTDAMHPHNIEVGFEKIGEFVAEPNVGDNFWVGHYWRTSIVQEIINETTFRTNNSIYRYEFLTNDLT